MVNVHMQASASPEPGSRTNAGRHHLSHSIQETLRGAFPRRPGSCGVAAALMLWLPVSVGEKQLVVLGDFGCSPQSSQLDILRKEKLCPLVAPTQFTNISTRSPQGSRCLDNIWMSRSVKKIFSGKTAHSAPVPQTGPNQNFLCEGQRGVVANGNRHCGKRSVLLAETLPDVLCLNHQLHLFPALT